MPNKFYLSNPTEISRSARKPPNDTKISPTKPSIAQFRSMIKETEQSIQNNSEIPPHGDVRPRRVRKV